MSTRRRECTGRRSDGQLRCIVLRPPQLDLTSISTPSTAHGRASRSAVPVGAERGASAAVDMVVATADHLYVSRMDPVRRPLSSTLHGEAVQMTDTIWSPTAARIETSALREYLTGCKARRAGRSPITTRFWAWSVEDLDRFWISVVDYFEVDFSDPWTQVRTADPMPHTRWFTGARLNWAQHALRNGADDATALLCVQEGGRPAREITFGALRRSVASAAGWLRRAGRASRRPGRRVPAEHRARRDRLSGRGLGRRRVGVLLPGLRRRGHHRSPRQLEPSVLDRDGRIPLERKGCRPQRRRRAAARERLPTLRHFVHVPVRVRPAAPRRFDAMGRAAGDRGRAAGVRTGRVLPPAVGAVHVGHHRVAQGPGARSRRDHPGRPQVEPGSTPACAPASASSRTPPPAGRCGTSRCNALTQGASLVLYEGSPGHPPGAVWEVAARTGAHVHVARCRPHHRDRQRRRLSPRSRGTT